MHRNAILALSATVLVSCGSDDKEEDGDDSAVEAVGIPALGGGTHELDSVDEDKIADDDEGLDVPRDLAFNPANPGELWVVNRADDSVSIFTGVGTDEEWTDHRVDPFAMHFMEEVSSISFGAATYAGSEALTFGTCQESRNSYNDDYPPNDFMGPTLWSADLDIFATTNEEAVEYLSDLFGFYTDLGSHLDMLHESPLCMGIAWEKDNVYWVFDGDDGRVVRYDFAEDHDIGYDDHSDGIIGRVKGPRVERVEDVPSHMDIDPETGLLYVADTGKNRILVIDTATGEKGDRLSKTEPGTDHHELEGVEYDKLLDGDDIDGMEQPSGLEVVDGHLLVTDHETGIIFAFALSGEGAEGADAELVDWLDTGRAGGIMGIDAPSLDEIWFVDAAEDELIRLTAK
jgi:hypothetical protein